jgi:membrane protease YdiL (CAAX protease family)
VTLDSLGVTLAAQLAVAPLLVSYFGQLPMAAPLANLLATPILPLIIVLSLVTAGVGLLVPPLSQTFGLPLWLAISYLYGVAHLGARLPVWELKTDSYGWLFAYYICLGLALWWFTHSRRRSLNPAVEAA